MKNLIMIMALLGIFTGCSSLPPQKVKVMNFPRATMNTRSDRYMHCIVKLSREGIKQSLIKELCDSTYGGLE